MKRRQRRRKGFTLVELMVVIMVIAMVMALVGTNVMKRFGRAKAELAKPKLALVEQAINEFAVDVGRYPGDSEGLDVLLEDLGETEGWNGPYIKASKLLDPWGNPIEYIAEGEINPGSFDLISYGADGAEGGEGDNADVYND
ncbi:type II secretion system major pseudopilin GspG [Planctomycetota bacterium]